VSDTPIMPSGCPLRVCLVEDEETVRDALCLLLAAHGIDAVGHASPASMLASRDSKTYACLILDMHLPGMTGLEVLEVLRRRGIETPAILITGRPAPDIIRRAAVANVAAFLLKPIEESVLLQAIRAAVGGGTPPTMAKTPARM